MTRLALLSLLIAGGCGGAGSSRDLPTDAGARDSSVHDASGHDAPRTGDASRDGATMPEADATADAGLADRVKQLRGALIAQVALTTADSGYGNNAQQRMLLALSALELNGDVTGAEALITSAFLSQTFVDGGLGPDGGPNAVGCYGNIDETSTTNTTSFTALPMVVLWDRWNTVLSIVAQGALMAHMHAAGSCLRRTPVLDGVLYTNIWLQTAACLVLIGEAASDNAMAADGYARLEK